MRARCLMVTLIGNLELALDEMPGTAIQQIISPWRHMEKLLYDIRLYDDEISERGEYPRQWPRNEKFKSFVTKTRTRLRTMLQCQYSFGTVVGNPVIFFLGGFILALLSSLDNLGNEDIAEAFAFGEWYMIIPHILSVFIWFTSGPHASIVYILRSDSCSTLATDGVSLTALYHYQD